MDKGAKDKLVWVTWREWRRIGCPKRSSLKNWKGRDEGGRPRKRWREEVERDLQVLGVRRWKQLVTDKVKMEGHCSTGQSPQRAVAPMEEEEEEEGEEEEEF